MRRTVGDKLQYGELVERVDGRLWKIRCRCGNIIVAQPSDSKGMCRKCAYELNSIRYHMGAFTDKEEWRDYTCAVHRYPNVLWTHHADMIASHVHGV